MAHVQEVEAVDLEDPLLVEGLPGVGLVGKIAADHLVSTFGMTHYANVHCESLPRIAVYESGSSAPRTPVRLYADEEQDLVVLQSDIPVEPAAATEFARCLGTWFEGRDLLALYVTGIPVEERDSPDLFGLATGTGREVLADLDLPAPDDHGAVSGPTGALLAHAIETDARAVGLVVETDPEFPDPAGARAVIERVVEPIAGVDCSVQELVDRAEEIRETKERLAERMGGGDERSSKARPLRMYQ